MYREPAEDEAAKYAEADAAEVDAFQKKMGALKNGQRLGVVLGLALAAVVIAGIGVFVALSEPSIKNRDPTCHVVYHMDVDQIGGHVTRREVVECGGDGGTTEYVYTPP